jgi:2-keto-4-pentenoate hydratase/2-oxohepta-3-ene-1,7-dioic acid hydratase in catechol pathway
MTFALGTFSARGRVFPGLLLDDERVVDLSAAAVRPQPFGSTAEILGSWDRNLTALDELAEQRRSGEGPDEFALSDLSVLAPVAPTQVLQSGANYRKHVIDLAVDKQIGMRPGMSMDDLREEVTRMMDERIESGEPYVFLGAPAALCGPYDDVELPARGAEHDWELELAAVVGRCGRNVPATDAIDYVAGYTICNDVTTRDLVQRPDLGVIGSDWLRSKNSPTFLPTGPWLVPARFVPDPGRLRITLSLNGDVMQDESTADMIFDVARLVSYVSATVGLHAGDLLLTGSPAGNGTHYGRFLRHGDVMEGEITGLGSQRNRCVGSTTGEGE